MEHSLQVLLAGLADPDPGIRDGWAYAELAEGIASGRFAGEKDIILATAVSRFGHDDIWARSFAPLVLAWLADAGVFDRAAFTAFARWYVGERDTRGHDPDHGWLHAVAHVADLLGVCVARGHISGDEALAVVAQRLLAPGTAWRHQEDARLARAVVTAVAAARDSGGLGASTANDPIGPPPWVADLHRGLDRFEEAAPEGEPPAWVHNTSVTCAKAHLALTLADAVPPPRRAAHLTGLAGVVRRMEPWLVP